MILTKSDKTIKWEKGQSFKQMTRENWISTCKRMKLDSHSTI